VKLSRAAKAAIKKYGRDACVHAHHVHTVIGEGASTIANCYPINGVNTTRQADAAINAGRELAEGAA